MIGATKKWAEQRKESVRLDEISEVFRRQAWQAAGKYVEISGHDPTDGQLAPTEQLFESELVCGIAAKYVEARRPRSQ
jgi:hypothetical protein